MENACDSPPAVGMKLRENHGRRRFRVAEVFPAGEYPGMILTWRGFNPSTGKNGARGQAFTTRDWRKRWQVV